MNRKTKTLLMTLMALVGIWVFAFSGFTFARSRKVTAEKILGFMAANDLSQASAADRARMLRELADNLNRLSYDDRRAARLNGAWTRWFDAMTEEEKSGFLEATMPAGFKQAITAFEQLPEDKRKKTVDDAYKRLREAQKAAASGQPVRGPTAPDGSNDAPPVALSEELRQKVTTIGLNTFLKESSAKTRSEVMPLLEEMQRTMQRGGVRR